MQAVARVFDEPDYLMEDVSLAAQCAETTLLITADSGAAVERLARHIHAASDRAASPFVAVTAATFPIDAAELPAAAANLLDIARGGSLLLTDVEEMPAIIQNPLIETFTRLQEAREPTGRVRLMAGTTTSLSERVSDGTFSERLFYGLNVIHVVAHDSTGLSGLTDT